MIVITEMVGIEIKRDPSNFKSQDLIMFKSCLNHVWILFGRTKGAIIINTVFTIFMIFFMFFYLVFFLQVKKKKSPEKNNPNNNGNNRNGGNEDKRPF